MTLPFFLGWSDCWNEESHWLFIQFTRRWRFPPKSSSPEDSFCECMSPPVTSGEDRPVGFDHTLVLPQCAPPTHTLRHIQAHTLKSSTEWCTTGWPCNRRRRYRCVCLRTALCVSSFRRWMWMICDDQTCWYSQLTGPGIHDPCVSVHVQKKKITKFY